MSKKTPKRPPADADAPDAAVAWFRERVPMTDDQFSDLDDESHATAFTVAGVAQLDLVEDVWSALDRAIANGETLEDFQARVGDRLASAWGSEQPWRLETIYRTVTASAYNAGRYAQMTEPAVKQARPFWRFSDIQDARESDICREAGGTVLPADHSWWNSHYPPLHHQCRSHVVTLSSDEAQDEGVAAHPPAGHSAEGFGAAPVSAPNLEPDLDEYPPELAKAYREG